jgi:hypothetical protein
LFTAKSIFEKPFINLHFSYNLCIPSVSIGY